MDIRRTSDGGHIGTYLYEEIWPKHSIVIIASFSPSSFVSYDKIGILLPLEVVGVV